MLSHLFLGDGHGHETNRGIKYGRVFSPDVDRGEGI